jgi:transcription elongation GreA/GreB family factor
MDKKTFMTVLTAALERELANAAAAAKSAQEAATGDDMASDGQYDTRAIEAGYLAGAQARRLAELEAAFVIYKQLRPPNFGEDDPIALGALVCLSTGGTEALYFLGPQAGGLRLSFQGKAVVVITPRSPIGSMLVGSHAGDELAVGTGDGRREYEIVGLW